MKPLFVKNHLVSAVQQV